MLAGATLAPAHDIITTKLTWSAEISRIIYRRCTSCHHEGGSTPMPLITYQEARPWAKAIRDEVLSRRMPPWGAIKGYGDLQDDVSLTQDEITRIAEWVEGGAPEGDPKYLPEQKFAQPETRATPQGRRVAAGTLKADIRLQGLHPLADVPDAKIIARKPDGSLEPLLWLHGYRNSWSRTFLLTTPAVLSKGTEIVSEPPVPIELLIKSPAPAR